MATTAVAFVTLISGFNRLLAAGATHQQVCRLGQEEADVHTGLIGLGKEDGVRGWEAAPAPPLLSQVRLDLAESSWMKSRGQLYLLGLGE